jgi:hypothetical protein
MAAIEWHHGAPPDTMRGKRLLIIGYPMNRNYFDDNRPDIFIGHFMKPKAPSCPPASRECQKTKRART